MMKDYPEWCLESEQSGGSAQRWRAAGRGRSVLLGLLTCALLLGPLAAFGADRLVRQDWWLLESDHFRVITNTRGDTPESIIRDLELFRAVVLKMTGVANVEEKLPTTAVVFRSMSEFKRLSGSRNIAGYMRPTLRGNWMVSGGDSLNMDQRQVMFHEYVHHLLRSASSVNYASWYDEGLADMLSSIYEEDGKVVVGAEAPARMQTLKNNAYQVSLEKIVNTDDLSDWHKYHVSYFYAMSWALVNYLNMGHMLGTPSRVPELNNYLALVQQDVPRPEAFKKAFGMTPSEMENKVNDYLGTRMRPVLMLPRDRFPVVENLETRRLTAAEISYELATLAIYGNLKLSRALVQEQLELHPDNAEIKGVLAVTYQRQGNYPEAEKLAREAVATNPDSTVLAIDLADILMAWNRHDCAEVEPVCTQRKLQAEALYRGVLELEPDNPEANVKLAYLLLAENRELDAAAESVEVGLTYQPWSASLNLLAGKVYLRLDDRDRARGYLSRALYWGNSESLRADAAAALKQLEEQNQVTDNDQSES